MRHPPAGLALDKAARHPHKPPRIEAYNHCLEILYSRPSLALPPATT